jgi:hypothetical protein
MANNEITVYAAQYCGRFVQLQSKQRAVTRKSDLHSNDISMIQHIYLRLSVQALTCRFASMSGGQYGGGQTVHRSHILPPAMPAGRWMKWKFFY